MRLTAFSLAFAVLLSSCLNQVQPDVYAKFDPNDKTIAFPANGSCAANELKKGLRAEGWRIRVSGATADVSEKGHVNATSKYTAVIEEGECRDASVLTPLSLLYLFPVFGWIAWGASGFPPIRIIPGQLSEHVSLTIFENKTGEEVLTYREGIVKTREATKKVLKAIRQNSASPQDSSNSPAAVKR